jgi:hypothetical protein
MCSSNRAHRVQRWIIIEKNPAATADLQVDEAGRKHRSRWHNFGQPVTRNLITWRDALNRATIDHDHGIIVPTMSIENAVGRNCRWGSSGVSGWF